MRIECIHGYFKFYEEAAGDAARFVKKWDLDLTLNEDHFIFSDLVGAPDYAILGNTYLGAAVTKTFEGKPWDVMRENNLVYNFNTGVVETIASQSAIVRVSQSENYYFSNGLILPGSLTDGGSRVTDYSAWFLSDQMKFRYSEIVYV